MNLFLQYYQLFKYTFLIAVKIGFHCGFDLRIELWIVFYYSRHDQTGLQSLVNIFQVFGGPPSGNKQLVKIGDKYMVDFWLWSHMYKQTDNAGC